MAATDKMHEMQVYVRAIGNKKQIFVYILRKSDNYKDAQLDYLKGEEEEFDLCLISTVEFNCKDISSKILKIILETQHSPRIKEIDRSKVDRVNFGEKTVFTIPSNAVVLKVIVIDDQDRLLVAESLDDKYSQLTLVGIQEEHRLSLAYFNALTPKKVTVLASICHEKP